MILALAINRDGLPIRHSVFPSNTLDVTTVEQVTEDLAGLGPRRFLFVGNRGMVSQSNVDFLKSQGRKYLLGRTLRDDDVVEHEVLSLRGRYTEATETLGVKQTVLEDGDRPIRYLLCRDTDRAAEDAQVRGEVLEPLDGKYVLMTNDLDTPAEELVLGYRDMWRAESAFRSMKTALNIEPVHERKPFRITSHAHLCVLTYLLVRVAERWTGTSWKLLRE